MQDTTCAFYKLQQTLAENPGILSQDEVSHLPFVLNCRGLLPGFGDARYQCAIPGESLNYKINYKEITVKEPSNYHTLANRTKRTCNFSC